jgi:hypothetical protein
MAKQTPPKGEGPLTYDILVRNPKLSWGGGMARAANKQAIPLLSSRFHHCLNTRQMTRLQHQGPRKNGHPSLSMNRSSADFKSRRHLQMRTASRRQTLWLMPVPDASAEAGCGTANPALRGIGFFRSAVKMRHAGLIGARTAILPHSRHQATVNH